MIYFVILFCFFILIGISFQVALAFGAPWGEAAMGGRFPGRFPSRMRIAAVFQAIILIIFGLVVLINGNIILPGLYNVSRIAIWIIVGFFALGTILHIITPSKWERRLWLPVNIILFLSSLVIAMNN
jgi:hypothetical protein